MLAGYLETREVTALSASAVIFLGERQEIIAAIKQQFICVCPTFFADVLLIRSFNTKKLLSSGNLVQRVQLWPLVKNV